MNFGNPVITPAQVFAQPEGAITQNNFNPFTHILVKTTTEITSTDALSDYELMRSWLKNTTTTIELRDEAKKFIRRFRDTIDL